MGKKRKSSSVAAESIFPLAPQPAASGNPFPEGTIGYAEHQKEHTNPFQFGTIGWTDWQRDHGLSTAPPPVDPKTGKGYLPSGDYTSGDAATDAFAKTLKKDDLWRFQKMEEHMAGKTLEGAMPPKTGSIYEDFKGPLEFLRSAGVAQKSTGGGDVENLTRELTELSNRGVQFGNKAMKNAGQINKMAPDLARWGVKSLNDLQAFDIPGRGTIYYNKGNNTVLPADFGSSMHGEGGTYFSLKNINGHVLPTTEWTDTSDRQAIMGGLSVLGAAAGLGGLGAAIGGATGLGTAGGNALVGAGMGGLQSAAGGGNFLKGALMGGLGGAVSALNPAGALGVTNPTLQAGLNSALSGGLRSAIGGGDVLQGAVSGGLSGLGGQMFGPLGGYAGGMLGNMLFNQKGTTPPQAYSMATAGQGAGGAPTSQQGAPVSSFPPSVLARLRQLTGQVEQKTGHEAGGLRNLAGWGQQKLGWT